MNTPSVSANAVATPRKRRLKKAKRQKYLFVYTALVPVILMFAVLRIIPIAQNLIYSFFDSTIGDPLASFVGLQNYKELFKDDLFLISIKNTTVFAVFVTLFGVLVALGVAILLTNPTKLSALYEMAYFLPVITPMVPVAVVWK